MVAAAAQQEAHSHHPKHRIISRSLIPGPMAMCYTLRRSHTRRGLLTAPPPPNKPDDLEAEATFVKTPQKQWNPSSRPFYNPEVCTYDWLKEPFIPRASVGHIFPQQRPIWSWKQKAGGESHGGAMNESSGCLCGWRCLAGGDDRCWSWDPVSATGGKDAVLQGPLTLI